MTMVRIDRAGVDECYKTGLVKPNEFRQIYTDIIEKEISLRLESMSVKDKLKMFLMWNKNQNWLLAQYSDYSYSQNNLYQSIMELAGNNPERLLISEEEAKLLRLSSIFYKNAVLVRNCSDLLKHPLAIEDCLWVNKETLRAIDYLRKYASSGKNVLAALKQEETI